MGHDRSERDAGGCDHASGEARLCRWEETSGALGSVDDVRRPWRPDACLHRAGKRLAPQRSDHVPPRRLGNVSLPRFVCALPGAPPARHDFRALPAGGTGCGRLRVVGGELVVELAGGAVLSRAACVAVHTPRRTWEHGDDLRWVRGVLLTWVRFSVVDVARNQGNLTGESRSRAGHRARCGLPSPACRQACITRPPRTTGSDGGGNCQHVRSWSSCVLTTFLLWLCSSSPRV